MRRVAVVGCSGSGKTTLARELARRIGAEHVELDSIFHRPGWTPMPREQFRDVLTERLAHGSWVTDGNYLGAARDTVVSRADTIVWLDLPLSVVMRQVIARTLRRVANREELWNGNRERWTNLIDPRPRENIILWALTQHGPYRRTFTALRADPAMAGKTWHRLRSRADMAAFLESYRPRANSPG